MSKYVFLLKSANPEVLVWETEFESPPQPLDITLKACHCNRKDLLPLIRILPVKLPPEGSGNLYVCKVWVGDWAIRIADLTFQQKDAKLQ